MDQQEYVSTGIKGLDKAIDSLRPGDTVTWQMENVGDYMYVATQFVVDEALTGRPMVYLRFGDHEELIPTEVLQARGANIRKITLDPAVGFETFAVQVHRIISSEAENTFFLLERVPAVARIVKKGSIVRATGYRDELHLAALPKSKAEECAALISSIFDMKCIVIPGILNLTMTPSNPILHTTRLKSMFEDYQPGVTYESIPLFYEDWTDQSSELLMKCDDEVQAICRALPEHHLNFVKSLRDHYESQTVEAMTAKISGISAFRGITTPSVEVNGRYIPDLHSRCFTADFSYGLSIIQQIARFAGVETPNIDEVMDWYQKIAVEKNSFRYADYGITDRESFDRFYLN